MRIYYAHCMALYHTPQELRDLELLRALFPAPTHAVINPNTEEIGERCRNIRAAVLMTNEYRVAKWGSHYRRQDDRGIWSNVPRDHATWWAPSEVDALRTQFPGITFEPVEAPRDPSQVIMDDIFHPLVASCDVLAFRALPDGSLPAGVAQEIAWADEAKKIVIELPSNLSRRTLTVAQTKAYLLEVGQR